MPDEMTPRAVLASTRWLLFDADTGEFYADKFSRISCERAVAEAWGIARRDLKVTPVSGGGWKIEAFPDAAEIVDQLPMPHSFFALPASHPSVLVRTMLAVPREGG